MPWLNDLSEKAVSYLLLFVVGCRPDLCFKPVEQKSNECWFLPWVDGKRCFVFLCLPRVSKPGASQLAYKLSPSMEKYLMTGTLKLQEALKLIL